MRAKQDEHDWPAAAFHAPLLRGLDARGQRELSQAGALFELGDGEVVYESGASGDSFFVVVSGQIELSALRRGDEKESVLRLARRGDSFGEEATLPGATRCTRARARGQAEVAEVPIAVFTRVLGRSAGSSEVAAREERALRRAAARDLVRTLSLGRSLSESDMDLLLDAASWQSFARGDRIFGPTERADSCFLVVDGLVQLTRDERDTVVVCGYLSRGDFFGEDDTLAGRPRRLGAVALGDCHCLRLPAAALRTLVDRNPGLTEGLARLAEDRQALQLEVVAPAADNTTQHVFHDLYRMQMARSLLAIDLDSCVRCGHCAWACSDVHGASRLVRRGDKVVTALTTVAEPAPRSLLLPNSCQHCKNPLCMIDCPTGAIGRDPEGEVFIRPELCTGCGACAKACPWDNIQMAPRRKGEPGLGAELAVKCDLCRDYEQPACVSACPTEAILRLDPSRDFADVRRLLAREASAGPAQARGHDWTRWLVPGATAGALILAGVGLGPRQSGLIRAGSGVGLFAGWVGLLACLALVSYALPKRLVRQLQKPKQKLSAARRLAGAEQASPMPRSRLRVHTLAHIGLGGLAMAFVLAHSGATFSNPIAGALAVAFWLCALLGLFGALAYRFIPPRLTRLERRGALPEDLAMEARLLSDKLYRTVSGKSELVKTLLDRVLLPYARTPLGPLSLLVSGRSLRQEQEQLKARIDAMLEGRGGDKLEGLDDLLRIVVEQRALPLRRGLSFALRAFLPLHVVLSAVLLVLLFAHVVAMVRW